MDSLTKKTLTTARGQTYTYYASPHILPASPTLLLLHGFPDHARMWDGVVAHLASHPSTSSYNLIIPDALGYGGTSKPTDLAAYAFSAMSADLADILAAESVARAVVVGHDWGSALAQHFLWHRRDRVQALVMVSVAYFPPDRSGWDLDGLNARTSEAFGYPAFAYWELLTAPDAPDLLAADLDRTWAVAHGTGPEWIKEIFCVPGAMRAFLEDKDREPKELRPYARSEKLRGEFERFKNDGFEGPLCWYRATKDGVQSGPGEIIAEELLRADLPVLYVGSTEDAVCRHELIRGPEAAGLLPDLEVHVMQDCGHWIPIERPEELGGYLVGFLERKISGEKA